MRSRRVRRFAAVAMAILLAAQVSCVFSRKQARSTRLPPPPGVSAQSFPVKVQEPRGVAAITPSKPGMTPVFTSEDLLKFVQTHPVPGVTRIEPSPKVTRLDCSQTAKSIATILRGKATGLPDTMRVCYVELQGKFALRIPPSKRNPERKSLVFNTSFEVFDAGTGNLMLSGGAGKNWARVTN